MKEIYEILYIVKYASYDSQTAVGRGIVDGPSKVSDIVAYQAGASTVEGWAATPNEANCVALAGRDGYVGTNGMTPVWCLGISNPWGNVRKFQEGVFQASGNIYYTENESLYTSVAEDIQSNFTTYSGLYGDIEFNSNADIYGSSNGQVNNPLLAYFMNNKFSSDCLSLSTNATVRLFARSGDYFFNGYDSAGAFFYNSIPITGSGNTFAVRLVCVSL